MDALGALAREHGLLLVEDAAQAHGATWRGRRAGSLGDVAAFSFYPSKNLGALGDGGAVCTGDEELATRVRMLRNLGQRSKGDHDVAGFNERLDGLQAAFLRAKLPHLDDGNERRRRHAAHYTERLSDAVALLGDTPDSPCIYHLFPVRVADRDRVAGELGRRGIQTGVHYAPALHEHAALAVGGVRAVAADVRAPAQRRGRPRRGRLPRGRARRPGPMSASLSAQGTYSGRDPYTRAVVSTVLEHVPVDAQCRLLDLGAGTGDAAFLVAAERPVCTVTALDLSPANVAAMQRRTEAAADRVTPVHGDVLTADVGEPYDVVLASQSLHLVEGATNALADRVAELVRTGGTVVIEMPYKHPYNTALITLRRVLRRLRGPALDRAALAVMRRLHGDLTAVQLHERLNYLYIVPVRLSSRAFDATLAARGLDLVDRRPMIQASLAQARHHISAYRKRS
jgi:SAM-dependent methyltransferase